MAKTYWISFYREITDSDKMAAYARLAGPAIAAGGGVFLARAVAAHAYETGQQERVTLIAFESMDKAVATHESAAYQQALKALDGGAVRDIRFVESCKGGRYPAVEVLRLEVCNAQASAAADPAGLHGTVVGGRRRLRVLHQG